MIKKDDNRAKQPLPTPTENAISKTDPIMVKVLKLSKDIKNDSKRSNNNEWEEHKRENNNNNGNSNDSNKENNNSRMKTRNKQRKTHRVSSTVTVGCVVQPTTLVKIVLQKIKTQG